MPLKEFNNTGGISRCHWHEGKIFSQKHEVHVFSSIFAPGADSFVTPHRVPSIRFPPSAYELSFALNAQKAMDALSPDIIASPATSCLRADIFTANSCHKAAIGLFKSQRGLGYSLLKSLEPKSRVILALEGRNFSKGNYVLLTALSKATKSEVAEYYKVPQEDITVVPPGVDVSDFKPSREAKSSLRRQYKIPEGVPIVLFCGHEFKRKGLAQSISALARVKSEWAFIVIGGQDPSQYIAQAQALGVKGRIHFAGFHSDIRGLFNGSDLFLFPTSYEPFGMVILEAMASGMPIVASGFAGASELAQNGKDGLLFDNPFDTQDIAEKLRTILESPLLMKKMGARARETSLSYTWEKIAERKMEVYKKAVEMKGRGRY